MVSHSLMHPKSCLRNRMGKQESPPSLPATMALLSQAPKQGHALYNAHSTVHGETQALDFNEGSLQPSTVYHRSYRLCQRWHHHQLRVYSGRSLVAPSPV